MHKIRQITISKTCHKKLIRWAKCTKKEIAFVCAGPHSGHITYVKRLRNTAILTRTFCNYNGRQYRHELARIKKLGLKYLFNGHSHPDGPSHPSYYDCLWLKGELEIIVAVCPDKKEVTAWRIKKTVRLTKEEGCIPLVFKNLNRKETTIFVTACIDTIK